MKAKLSCHRGDACVMGVNESHVRGILAASDKPMTAYDIIPILSQKLKHPVAPTTVYRALNHLTAHGIVTRIESRNAYVLCQHPQESHDCLFFICRVCGAATEAPDTKISRLLRKEAEALGFDVSRQILEIVGLCKKCAKQGSAH
ncbi:MAG: Fur family transcriptional regulator [Alphaproteobacteria bacterium]|nr:Fur family transcriptional regulator [Alphaproteobacteria bacterium]